MIYLNKKAFLNKQTKKKQVTPKAIMNTYKKKKNSSFPLTSEHTSDSFEVQYFLSSL